MRFFHQHLVVVLVFHIKYMIELRSVLKLMCQYYYGNFIILELLLIDFTVIHSLRYQ